MCVSALARACAHVGTTRNVLLGRLLYQQAFNVIFYDDDDDDNDDDDGGDDGDDYNFSD